MKIAHNVASILVGWEPGEYGRPRDNDLPWPPDLGALALDQEASDMMDELIDEVLMLTSASDVCVCKLFTCIVNVCLWLSVQIPSDIVSISTATAVVYRILALGS